MSKNNHHKIMRLLITLTICLASAVQTLAVRISEETALQKAQEFTKGKALKKSESPIGLKKVNGNQTSPNYYVFNIGEEEGFVIVSGDDRTRSILGYSDNGSFNPETVPSNMRWLLDGYDAAIGSFKDGDAISPAKTIEENGVNEKSDIAPLISTQWGQGSPYNNSCPVVNGKQCVTGCVATATAQVINYHKWPQFETTKVDGYTTFLNKIEMDELPARQFSWDNMDDNEIADLMLYCGQALNMNYTPQESASSGSRIPHVMTDIFHFGRSALYEERKNYSNQEWTDLLYDQLYKGLPILYFGTDMTSGGHAFIIDGYENGMYHVNWGWEGSYDGYFTIDQLNPSSNRSFSSYQQMASYVCPPVSVEDSSISKIVVQNFSCNQTHLERSNKYLSFPRVDVSAILASDLSSNAEIQIAFALSNENGIVKILADDSFEFYTTDTEIKMTDDIYITADIPVGDYRLIAVNRTNNSDKWLPDSKSHARYIDVKVGENELSLQTVRKGEDGIEKIEFGTQTIDGIRYRLVSEYDILRAYILTPLNQSEYSGDVFIPDYVDYETFHFEVFGEEGTPFKSNSGVTSISSPISLTVSDCPNLKRIEFREGVLEVEKIENCPKLEKISYPSSCRVIRPLGNCPSLIELSFQNIHPITILQNANELVWSIHLLPALSDIYFEGDEPPILELEKLTDNTKLRVHVPRGMKETYSACGWKDLNIVDDLKEIEEHVKWDYIGNDENCDDGILAYSGDNDVELAMKIPSEETVKYIGNKIIAIEYFTTKAELKDNVTKNPDYVFLTENDKEYVIKQATTAVRGSWTRVLLDEPYEISDKDIFVGVGRQGRIQMNWANYDIKAGGFWYRAMGTDHSMETPGIWLHNSDEDDLNYPMPIRAIIQGDNLPSDIAILSAEYEANKVKPLTEEGKITMKIRNRSPRLAKNAALELCYDGKTNETVHIPTLLPANHEKVVEVLPRDLRFNTHVLEIDLKEIDGKPDALHSNSKSSLKLLPTDFDHYPRVTVMEEYTDNQDGSCTLGIATKEYMKKNCGDDYLSISIHKCDEMKVKDGSYDEFLKVATPTSFANVNRTKWQYGFMSINDVRNQKSSGEALVKSEAAYTEEGRIKIVTKTAFSMNHNENDSYNIAYVLVEDNVGPYIQKNNYSRPSAADNPNDYMNWWTHQGREVSYEFSDVARTIHTYKGVEGLFPTDILKDEVYDTNYLMKIPDYIQNCENLKVISLLIDKNTGEILNAHSTGISGVIPDMSPELGDSNGNGAINIADAVNIANYVVGKEVEKIHYTASDVNNDGDLSFADASATVSMILNLPAQSMSECKRINHSVEYFDSDCIQICSANGIAGGPGSLYLSMENPAKYVALQADVILLEDIAMDNIRIGKQLEKTHKLSMRRIDDNTIRVIIFDINNRAFAESCDPILEIVLRDSAKSGNVTLRNVIASDADAHDYYLIANGETSGNIGLVGIGNEKNIEINSNHNSIEIRNAAAKKIIVSAIDGRRITTIESASDLERIELPSGVFIVKVGSVSEKIMVK